MKIESQVCSLEFARKLKELCVAQESYWSWYQGIGGDWFLGDPADTMNNAVEISHTTAPHFNQCAAFSVTELGDMLPPYLHMKKRIRTWEYWLHVERFSHGWIYSYGREGEALHQEVSASEADARAKMLIYLLENGLVGS